MRLTLDTTSRAVLDYPLGRDLESPLPIVLGDPAISLQVTDPTALAPLMTGDTLTQAARLEFIAKPTDADRTPSFAEAAVVTGALDVETVPTAGEFLELAEDWKAAALVELFEADTASVLLAGMWRWRTGAEVAAGDPWHHTRMQLIEVASSLFTDDIIPAASAPSAPFLYLSAIDAYTGTATALDAIVGAQIPSLTLLKVIVDGDGSEWRVAKPAGAVVTDLDAGVIRLLDGSGYLTRVSSALADISPLGFSILGAATPGEVRDLVGLGVADGPVFQQITATGGTIFLRDQVSGQDVLLIAAGGSERNITLPTVSGALATT